MVKTHVTVCTSSAQFLHTLLHSDPGSSSLCDPTLQQLGTASNISTAFCPSISSLLAHLAVLPYQPTVDDGKFQKLVLISSLALLNSSPSPSVQSLAQVLCAAAECANAGNWDLEVVECVSEPETPSAVGGEKNDMNDNEEIGERDTWDVPMPILSNTVGKIKLEKAGWTPRSVTPRTVALRWFRFASDQPS